MLDGLLVAFGVNAAVIPKLWQNPPSGAAGDKSLDATPQGLLAIHSTLDRYKRRLLPGKKLDSISKVLLGNISESLGCDHFECQHGLATSRVSLKDFCARILVSAITRIFFGDRILGAEPELVQSLLDFNDGAWMLIFHYPQSAASKLNKARCKIFQAFVNYIQSPEDVRSGRAWLIETVMKEQEAVDIRDEDRAALLLMVY